MINDKFTPLIVELIGVGAAHEFYHVTSGLWCLADPWLNVKLICIFRFAIGLYHRLNSSSSLAL